MKKIILLILSILSVFTLTNCRKHTEESSNNNEETRNLTFSGSDLKIGMSYEILGNVSRNIASDVSDEGARYPTYGTSLDNITEEEKTSLINESNYLKASNTTYNKMDKDGNLYLNDELLERKFYKHSTSLNTYYGTVSDTEKAVIKKLTYSAREVGNHLTGLYAPAGEVIKITLSEEDLEKTGGVKIEMGQYSQNNELNNIWQARSDFSRMPLLGNEMLVDSTLGYVGTFLGGPIYVTPLKQCDFSITISGAVEYTHFIYGLTSEEEFNRLKDCSAPYFDFEIYDACVRHSGPKKYAPLDYDNLNNVSSLWVKISNISRQIPAGSRTSIGIDFLYDPFIAAGGAVAFVGRNWCNLPPDWMTGSLDYDSFITNGMWGTIHEYNHHFQRYGFVPGDEVTNNAISLLSYISYTKISEDRDSLSGWNRYLNPEVSLKETLTQSSNNETTSSLNTYADIIHTFGVNTFIEAAKYKKGSGGVDNWYESLCETTGYNMEYYFALLNQTVTDTLKEKYSSLPMFIPATLKEQTGKVINGVEQLTVLPYKVTPSENYTIDLDSSLTIPSNFTYKIKKVSSESNTKFKIDGNKILIDNSKQSKTLITLTIENGTYSSDITFIIELNPKYAGINLETYTYNSRIYSTAKEALEANFKNASDVNKSIVKKHFINGIHASQIASYYGKIYMNKSGTYKISVRTSNRTDTYLETGLNSSAYSDSIESPRSNPIDCKINYITYNVKKGDYIYFRVTLNSYHNDGFGELYGSFDDTLSSISTSLLYNDTSNVLNFTSEDLYTRTYSSPSFSVPYTNQTIVSYTSSYKEWDDNYKISNILDGNSSTSYHSVKDKMISSEPFELTIDLGKVYSLNTLNITTYNGNQAHYPTEYKLYVGTSLDSLEEVDIKNDKKTNRNQVISFNTTNFRYYKLVITDTSEHKYVALSDINMSLNTNGNLVSAKNAKYIIKSNETFNYVQEFSTFGYTITGNGSFEITCENNFGLITKNSNSQIELTIDDKTEIVNFDEIYYIEFSGIKKIKVKILNDSLAIDSFII